MVLIIRKFVSLLLAFALLGPTAAYADGAPGISAHSAIVISGGGEVVFEKNADERMLIASTTKIMTALVALENAKLDDRVEIPAQCCGVEGSSMYLRPGDEYTLEELIRGLLLVSGNDAASAIAVHTAGSEGKFVAMMNSRARSLGMADTHFENPHGLDAPEHYSTARDMGRLMAVCMNNPDFARISAMTSSAVGGQTLINHNRLLSLCQGCTGGKTGYTQAAGRCLVSCCQRGEGCFICVTLSAPDDWNDHMKLYDWAFSGFSTRLVTEGVSFEVPLISGSGAIARLIPEDMYLFLPNSAQVELRAELPWFVFAPVKAGEEGGSLAAYLDGVELGRCRLLFEKDIPAAERMFGETKTESLK